MIQKLLLLFVFVIFTPSGVPLPAVARICPNGTEGVTVTQREVNKTVSDIEAEGCGQIQTIPLNGDYVFVYGVKVLIGE